MLGLIWFVQVVHYPLFARMGTEQFPHYENAHTNLTRWVTAPPMIVEIVTGVLLIWFRLAGITDFQCWLGLALLAVIWISTFFVQIPCHEKLSKGFDSATLRKLIATNWIRTSAWSLRGVLVLWMSSSIIVGN